MKTELVLLAVLMFVVTYPSRALGLLAPGMDRLPRRAFEYLQLVGPAILAALAAVAVMVVTTITATAASAARIAGPTSWRYSKARRGSRSIPGARSPSAREG